MIKTIDVLPTLSGTYVLVARLQHKGPIRIGKLGTIPFAAGIYAYVGSAFGPGGLAARVGRHVRGASRLHWHIDYFLEQAVVSTVYMTIGQREREHQWAAKLADQQLKTFPIDDFGCSDCACRSHLVRIAFRPQAQRLERLLRPEQRWVPATSS